MHRNSVDGLEELLQQYPFADVEKLDRAILTVGETYVN